ncbi:MAG TPA: mannosyltransferase family protein [Acidimicrobiales bacterium]|nr:mannosyltransferase family protein [Acidimicrobiales bacterium]
MDGRSAPVVTRPEAPARPIGPPGDHAVRRRLAIARLASYLKPMRWPVAVYLGSRLLLLVVALVDDAIWHKGLMTEFTNWDGRWYVAVAAHGYPDFVVRHGYTTLGFFPLYPMLMWLVAHVLVCSVSVAGLVLALVGGFVATLLVERLALGWWGPTGARRAVAFFCFFPGAVVFSMAYSEGVLIPLAAGCILACEHRRWLAAGVLAGLATAVGPDGVVLIVVCAVAAAMELRRVGWRDPSFRRSLVAPVLSPVGVAAFGLFLWVWTGSPFASLIAQHDGWGERIDGIALVRQAQTLAGEISLTHFDYHKINLNLVVGLLGVIVLVAGLALLVRRPRTVSLEARIWAFGIAVLTVTSEYVPPNPRFLLIAFPLLAVLAVRASWRGYWWLMGSSIVLFAILSGITYVDSVLRP